LASPSNTSSARQLSVVVGSVEAARSIAICLDSLLESCRDHDAELIVVDAGDDNAVATAVRLRPGIDFIQMPADTLTPRLWSEGLAASSGRIVAFTTGHCFVTRNWAAGLISAIERGAAAAGGPLKLHADASILDAAIFFLRYSAFIEGKDDSAVNDVAGDNAAYARVDIPEHSWSRELGFWERDVNRALLTSGKSLAWVDSAFAEFGRSFSFRSICSHRFSHGRLFGHSRVTTDGENRLKILVGSVLVPFVLAARAGSRVLGSAAYRMRFIVALPLILVIASCWAAGEAAGAMEASVADRR